MIRVSEDTAYSFIQSINSSAQSDEDFQAYLAKFYKRLDLENHVLLEFLANEMESAESEEFESGLINGFLLCYELIRRQVEAEEMKMDIE